MQIRLRRRLGQNKAGAVIDRSPAEAQVLITGGFADHVDQPATDEATATGYGDEDTGQDFDARVDQLTQHTLAELKDLATQAGVAAYGTKPELAARIATAEADSAEEERRNDST